MLKFYRFFLICLMTIQTGVLSAYVRPCPGQWALDIEYLYLLPSVDDTYFVIKSPSSDSSNVIGSRKNNDLGFHSGFRVGGAYAFCECSRSFQAYYTRLNAQEAKTVSGNFLWATLGRPDFASEFESYNGSAHSKLNLLYQRVDGFFDQQIWCCCGVDLSLFAGFEYAYFRLREQYEYLSSNNVGNINQKSKTWGIGPQLGLAFNYRICNLSCCCPGALNLAFSGSCSTLAGKTKTRENNYLDGSKFLDVSDQDTWRLIPVAHARVGLNYDMCFSCFGASLEVGYEFNSYFRTFSRVTFPDDVADSLCFTNYYNFDVQGLYVAANFLF